MLKNRVITCAVGLLLALIIVTSSIPCKAETNVQTSEYGLDTSAQALSADIYLNYSKKYDSAPFGDGKIKIFESVDSDVLTLSEGQRYSNQIHSPKSGMYALEVTYLSDEDSKIAPSFAVNINNKLPFYEASNINLPGIYTDDYSAFGEEILTDNCVAEQKKISEYQTAFCYDTIGYYGDILYFYLEEGSNSIDIILNSGKVTFKEISFCSYDIAPDYKDVSADFKDGYYSDKPIYFEAEKIQYKSDTSILALNDASSAALSPASPYEKYLNIIGGSNWGTPGQYVQWEFEVPQNGYYNITVKYRQESNVGMNSYRRILIDGKVPYSELEQYAFPYSSTFKNETLNDGEKPMYFYLEKGTHTLRMQVLIGELSAVLPYINEVVNTLTEDYRQVIMITGTAPDTLRDYFLENTIPETLDSFKEQNKKLRVLWKEIETISGSSSSGSKVLGAICEQLTLFEADSYNITQELASFKSNISSLCNWLLEAKTQPLKIDYFALSNNSEGLKKARGGVLESIIYNIKSFIFTFSSDYEGNSVSNKSPDTITVWVTGSSTKYNILNRLIVGDFQKQNPDIRVDLKLVTSNLSTSIIAGKNPDIALEQNATEIMNLVYRNAVVDLTRFSDFDEIIPRFRESALSPISFGGKLYALPHTQTFSAVFYRTDVLEELELDKPQTWEDVIYILSELKKNNLEFGIPHTMDTFVSMIYQQGGQLYNEKLTATDLNTYEAIDAFTTFTSFFTDYSAPLAYNALNRFRTGEMPILIGELSFYNTLKVLAPEIERRWAVTHFPATILDDGTQCAYQNSNVTGDLILNEEKAEMCWEFLKWKSSTETQLSLSEGYEMSLGQSERLMTANGEAFLKLGWSTDVFNLIKESEKNLKSVPAVPGSYYVSRHINNAIARVIYNDQIPGNALKEYASIIDAEIEYKTKWFGLNEEE